MIDYGVHTNVDTENEEDAKSRILKIVSDYFSLPEFRSGKLKIFIESNLDGEKDFITVGLVDTELTNWRRI